MLKNEREREIINMLKEAGGFITVKELCSKLYASESSIRRDLTALEHSGIVKKTYGGAEFITNFANVATFNQRTHHNVSQKKIIAKKAVSLIKEGHTVFLDQSTTALYLAKEIAARGGVTVVTNNVEIIYLLTNSSVRTISSGGMLSTDNRMCLVGTDAQYIFQNIYADFAFFSAKSIDTDGTISDCDREEVSVRGTMLANAAKRVFLCDREKFMTRSAYKQCSLENVDYMISESEKAEHFSNLSPHLTIL